MAGDDRAVLSDARPDQGNQPEPEPQPVRRKPRPYPARGRTGTRPGTPSAEPVLPPMTGTATRLDAAVRTESAGLTEVVAQAGPSLPPAPTPTGTPAPAVVTAPASVGGQAAPVMPDVPAVTDIPVAPAPGVPDPGGRRPPRGGGRPVSPPATPGDESFPPGTDWFAGSADPGADPWPAGILARRRYQGRHRWGLPDLSYCRHNSAIESRLATGTTTSHQVNQAGQRPHP